MSTQRRLPFKRPVKRKPPTVAVVPVARPERESLKSFVSPEVWALIEQPPVIKHKQPLSRFARNPHGDADGQGLVIP
jgi:hypothetical protein